MAVVELSAGPIEYEEKGHGAPVLFLHGLLMDRTAWRNVLPHLARDFRCIAPTLPLGSHRQPMRSDANLTLRGQARLVIEFIERLDLAPVTLVGMDTGGGLAQLVIEERPECLARLVLISAEAFDNYPPGLPGWTIWLVSQVPGGLFAALKPLALPRLRRLPMTLGWMSKRPVPHDVMDGWLRPASTDRRIRRDLRKYVRGARRDRGTLATASRRMASFGAPTLIVWSREDRIFPVANARRLAEVIPDARLVEITDSYTLIPEDQPAELTRQMEQFLAESRLHGA